MKSLIQFLLSSTIVLLLATQTHASGPRVATATMNVSVTVVEPSHIHQVQPVALSLNGEDEVRIEIFDTEAGSVGIAGVPGSEMMVQVKGGNELSDGNGNSLAFTPQITLGRDVAREQPVSIEGTPVATRITESGNGNYRGTAELRMGGTLSGAQGLSGTFTAQYTITTEHF